PQVLEQGRPVPSREECERLLHGLFRRRLPGAGPHPIGDGQAGAGGGQVVSTYRDAGVDIDAGSRTVELIKPLAESTQGPEVLAGVGPFSGLFALDTRRYQQPVLVASTDGVGTKVLLASESGRHAQIG